MNKEIKFQITNIDLLEATLNPQNKSLEENQVFNYDINLENKQEIFGKYKAGCVFQIENLENFKSKEDENKLDLPNNLIVTLNSVSISTIRGMMANFYRGTSLHNAILPIINPASFSKESAKN